MIRVGDKLKEERKRKNLTLEVVAKATKIRPKFLQAIEEGTYEQLPGPNYAHGFVKNYIEFLELPVREYMALFRREYDENLERKLMPQGLVGKENIPLKKFSFRQIFWMGAVVLLGLAVYLLFQYKAAFWPPLLSVSKPQERSVVSAQALEVKGTTDPNVAVTVNDLPAFVDPSGNFTKEVPVFPGNVTIVIKAVNSFGKETIVERHVQVTLPK